MRDHRKLEAFQLADEMMLSVYAITKKFPNDERFALTSQIRRAAVSIGANIVEGSARDSKADYVRFLGIAFASAREIQYELSIASRLGYMSVDTHKEIDMLASRTCSALHALIKALR